VFQKQCASHSSQRRKICLVYVCVYRYGDDPTIMAWDLINEPRCYKCGDRVQVLPCLIMIVVRANEVICSVDSTPM